MNPYVRRQSLVVMSVERRLYQGASCPLCICPTKRIADELERWYGVPSELIEIVPHSADVDRFRFDRRSRAELQAAAGALDERLVPLFVHPEQPPILGSREQLIWTVSLCLN